VRFTLVAGLFADQLSIELMEAETVFVLGEKPQSSIAPLAAPPVPDPVVPIGVLGIVAPGFGLVAPTQ